MIELPYAEESMMIS